VTNRKVIDLGIDPVEAEITKSYYGCPYMTGIDLYPLDYVPQDFAQMDTVKNLYSAAYDLAFNFESYRANGELEGYLSELEKLVGTKVKRDEHIRNNIWKLADRIAMMTQRRESRHVLWYSDWVASRIDPRRKISWYQNQVFMPFEMMNVPVPEGYDGVLRVRFGDKYMTPMQQKGAHDYPFFAEQERKIMAYKYGTKLQELY
jgi:lipopolysaccharide cholinephosphotransferase